MSYRCYARWCNRCQPRKRSRQNEFVFRLALVTLEKSKSYRRKIAETAPLSKKKNIWKSDTNLLDNFTIISTRKYLKFDNLFTKKLWRNTITKSSLIHVFLSNNLHKWFNNRAILTLLSHTNRRSGTCRFCHASGTPRRKDMNPLHAICSILKYLHKISRHWH